MQLKLPSQILVMSRYTLLGMLIQCLFVGLLSAAEGNAQNQSIDKINLSLITKGVSLEDALVTISEKTSLNFQYDQKLVRNIEIDLNFRNSTLGNVLRYISKETNLGFRRVNETIYVKEAAGALADTREMSVAQLGLVTSDPSFFASSKLELNYRQHLDKIMDAGKSSVAVTVSGVVKGDDGEVLPGVNVIEKGTVNGVSTDTDGRYKITVASNNSVLVFSYIGYVTQEITLGSRRALNVDLLSENKSLEEVVVVGYGVQRKESVVGAITQVDNKALMRSGTSNVTNAIAGKLSGVLTMQSSGEPGNDHSEIIIRGLSSWNGSQPLIMVDGVERDFKDMDPNEIATISVLKDASATAVFGAKGANGVVIVTTKRGVIGKPKLDFTASYGLSMATRIPDHISSYTTMTMYNQALMNGQQFTDLIPQSSLNEYRSPSTPLNSLRYPNVNWFETLTKPFATTANANFNVSGGTSFIKYFTSLGYTRQGDFFKAYNEGYDDTRYWYNRFNYRTNIDFNLTKKTTLSLNVGGETGIKNQPSSSPWRNLYATGPARYPAYFPSWVLEQVPDLDYPNDTGERLAMNFGEYTGNPYTSMHQGSFNRYLDSKLFTDLILDQKLDVLTPGLSARGKVSLSTYYRNNSLTASYSFPEYQLNYDKIGSDENPWFRLGQGNEIFQQAPLDINVGGLQNDYYKDLYYELSLNYIRSFGKHHVSGLVLGNRQQKDKTTEFPYYNQGIVGRGTYDFSGKYLVEVNVGYTGSERFAPGNRYGFFPSGAVGYMLSEEKFMKKHVPWISKLKFRYSDGKVGSDVAANRWLYLSDYFKDNAGYIREDLGANSVSQWEEARKRDFGVELGLWNDSFTFSVDLFDEKREKMLLVPQSVTMLVGNSFKELNLGRLKKHGIEFEAEYRNKTAAGLNYFVRGIFGFNENRILYKDDLPYAADYQKAAGKPLGAQLNGVELTGSGYYTSVDDIHNNVSAIDLNKLNVGDYKYLDFNADGLVNSLDKYPIPGSDYPPLTYSFSSGFSFKKFDFNFIFQGNVGKYVEYNQTYEVEFIKGDWRVHESQLDYWTPTNPTANHATLHYSGGGSTDNLFWGGGEADRGFDIMVENRFWRNANYLRLKEVYASYTFSSKLLKRIIGTSDLVFFVTGNNLKTFTKLIEGDPEYKDFNQGFYPQMTSIKFAIKAAF
ncbi:TonB-linked SusC/RagA family outer membrane protein [Dyadobacter jejuensis]|uniref:TonB-linked SusC/RagA family outer membrane protein n=1 Tax=Dyadobacter jejuensis TaxID=1082580 RepID=A0A316AHU3_9BACT|nr:SusC/RagA family TonB-linked outer membrane protein [Dyadobacter jejuensis]PWJ56858.1 TonB-linked SusC/RagA family outer membrane protein [Dyadobacter jejuensis]